MQAGKPRLHLSEKIVKNAAEDFNLVELKTAQHWNASSQCNPKQ